MIIIIDNYDSFTYNLYQYIGEMVPEIEVYRNDKISIEEVMQKRPTHIILSPGPGYPRDAGITIELIRKAGPHIPILGVCLGHQAMGEAYGGKVGHAKELMHGKASDITILRECALFTGLPERLRVGRYHSLIVQKEQLPHELEITAETDSGEIMGLKHKKYPVYGIQFHPESVLTPRGKDILKNFLAIRSAS